MKNWIKNHKKLSIVVGMLVFFISIIIISITTFNKRMSKIEETIKSEDYATAKILLDKELSKSPELAKVYLLFADYYVALKEYLGAIKILEQGLKKLSGDKGITNKLDEIKNKYSVEIESQIKQKEQEELAKEQEIAKQKEEIAKNREKEEKLEREKFVSSCKTVDWKKLIRNSETYKNQPIKVTGKITQIMSGGWFTQSGVRLYEDYEITKGDTYLQKEWYVAIDVEKTNPKILKDDIVVFYGTYTGTTEITRALTKTKDTVPTIDVKYYEIKN